MAERRELLHTDLAVSMPMGGLDNTSLPPSGQPAGSAHHRPGRPLPFSCRPRGLTADYFKKWSWPATLGHRGLGASGSSWLPFSDLVTSHPRSGLDSLGRTPHPCRAGGTERSLSPAWSRPPMARTAQPRLPGLVSNPSHYSL